LLAAMLGASTGCVKAPAPAPEFEADEPAASVAKIFEGTVLEAGAPSSEKVLDLAALRECVVLGTEMQWVASEIERNDAAFKAASERQRVLRDLLAPKPGSGDANDLATLALRMGEASVLKQRRSETADEIERLMSRYPVVVNRFQANCADADYYEADVRTVHADVASGKGDGGD